MPAPMTRARMTDGLRRRMSGLRPLAAAVGLRLLRTAGLVLTPRAGRVVSNRLADDFPEPLRDHCLRQLVELTHRTD